MPIKMIRKELKEKNKRIVACKAKPTQALPHTPLCARKARGRSNLQEVSLQCLSFTSYFEASEGRTLWGVGLPQLAFFGRSVFFDLLPGLHLAVGRLLDPVLEPLSIWVGNVINAAVMSRMACLARTLTCCYIIVQIRAAQGGFAYTDEFEGRTPVARWDYAHLHEAALRVILPISVCSSSYLQTIKLTKSKYRPLPSEHARLARWLVHVSDWGTVSTQSTSLSGFAYGCGSISSQQYQSFDAWQAAMLITLLFECLSSWQPCGIWWVESLDDDALTLQGSQ